MNRSLITVAGVLLASLSAALAAPPAGAAGARTTFVIDTQFVPGPSAIVSATGPLSSCTSALDLEGDGVETGPRTVLFSGVKLLQCGSETVTVSYEASINLATGRRTSGTWQVVDSTLAGVESGGGQVKGDAARCTIQAGSDGCILDTFRGSVS
ncbi:hypothetical protein G7072_03390 [Nocardioides sp. HDW12B]|uniref:hypothetical protein n=1 Tax=Nocardioides sp. HDW12B TaxID=2714939 RepID=UPI00140E83B5|nr:hypothetical protein [Nocardioides sp. HDW12B]QIK65512.1 hypothetical protein G7072_03390 [Nocardioides sp. HDW12B]